MIFFKLIFLILSLWFTISIFSRLFIIAVGIKYNQKGVAKPITTGQFLVWAWATGIFIALQWL